MAKKDNKRMGEGSNPVKPLELELMDFDVWYIMRSPRIPSHHMKEIIRADFKGRGLSSKETMDDFDKALASYGIKL